MRVLTTDQRTDEWFKARCGRLTSSAAEDMLATAKKGEASGRRDLRVRLVVERLTGQPQEDGYANAWMQRGIDREPDALAAYEALTGLMAWPVGFLAHDELMAGTSPDGMVDNSNGVLELKCPKSATHLAYLKDGRIPSKYMPQITHHLWITGAAWCDFVSFDDRFPPELQIVRYRLLASDVDLAAYELVVRLFLSEVDKEVAELTARIGAAA